MTLISPPPIIQSCSTISCSSSFKILRFVKIIKPISYIKVIISSLFADVIHVRLKVAIRKKIKNTEKEENIVQCNYL